MGTLIQLRPLSLFSQDLDIVTESCFLECVDYVTNKTVVGWLVSQLLDQVCCSGGGGSSMHIKIVSQGVVPAIISVWLHPSIPFIA